MRATRQIEIWQALDEDSPERRRRLNSIVADMTWKGVYGEPFSDADCKKDLERVLGSSGVASEVISGRRNPSKRQVKKLASFFGVSPKFFVSID